MPTIILIGDSIRMGYQAWVQAALAGEALVTAPAENCGHTFRIREHLHEWVIAHQPDIVHLNAGIHDLGWMPGETVPRFTMHAYARHLRLIIDRLRRDTNAHIIFATTTPFLTPCGTEAPPAACRSAGIVDRYNRTAVQVMHERDVPINDLNRAVHAAGLLACLGEDKLHMSDYGNAVLADAVVATLRHSLATRSS